MLWVILVIIAVVVIGGGVALASGLLSDSRKQLDDYSRVVPGVGPEAPAAWAGAHSPEAKLHRRLRDAVKAAHAQPSVSVTDLAGLDHAAAALDERLIGAAALPTSHRDAAIAEIEPLVARFEDAVAGLARAAAPEALGVAFEQSMAAIEAQLAAIAEARAEVERIDRPDGGLPPG